VFTLEGLTVGTSAAVVGTLAGWALSLALGSLGLFSSEAFYIPAVPARMVVDEVLAIAVACIASATVAAGLASAQVLRVAPGEVLKHA
jgi:ABC-type lipoprotein release transport system permease subunit